MLDQNLWGEFELVEFETRSRGKGLVTIASSKRQLNISSKFIKELKWEDGQRLNLYRFGETFALKPHKVGLVRLKRARNSGTIPSANMCLEILSRTRSCRVFEGWVEEDVLFFKAQRGEE